MATIMSTGQITIVDLTDQRTSSFYLQANRSKIQTYDVNEGVYSPNYAGNEPVVITPSFFFGNEDYTTSIEMGDISYYINGSTTAADKKGATDTGSGDYYQSGQNLIIQQNIGAGTLEGSLLRIKAVITEGAITDNKTQLSNAKIEAIIEFARVDSGKAGVEGISITSVKQQYLLTSSADIVPDKTDSGWDYTHEPWSAGKYLWIRTEITYSNSVVEYTDPYCDSSWKAAADGVSQLSERIDGVDELIEALQKEVDGAIETWYLEGDPTTIDFINPWPSEDTNEEHVGDLYFDTKTGKSYRYFKDVETYKWQIITDSELTQAMKDIQVLQTEVDGKVTIYYDATEPALDKVNIDDLWIKPDGNFYQCTGTIDEDGKVTNKKWELANITIDTVTIEYAEHTSNTNAPESGWKATAPTWSADKYVWQRTVTTFKDNAKATHYSDPVCISAAASRGITISGEQVFKSQDGGASYAPTSITLTANCMGGLTAGKWYYKNGSDWNDTGSTGNTFILGSGHVAFGDSGMVATIKVMSNESDNYYDIISIYKVVDGTNGEPASSVFLTNENITFAADKDGRVAAVTITCNVVAYTGATKVTPTVGTINSTVNGMTISKDTTANNEVPIIITIAANSTLGSSGATSGTISVPISEPVSTTKYITWSKVNTGATGAAGSDAIFAVVESTSGKVVFTDAEPGDITLTAKLYKGGAVWTEDVSYTWSTIPSGGSGSVSTLTVGRDSVPSAKSFICKITYDGKEYVDSIALTDKTDAIYCVIESTNGDKFTNGNITTNLICRVFNAYGEVEDSSKYTYTWEKYVNGTKDSAWSRTGKQISIDQNDVTAKATFACVVTK